MEIKITHSAAERIKELIASSDKQNQALRISVDGGGCSGFMYNYQLVTDVHQDDFIAEHHGAQVVVDPTSQQFLNHCTVEFIRELGGSYFQIINPQAKAKCGCGNSFAIS